MKKAPIVIVEKEREERQFEEDREKLNDRKLKNNSNNSILKTIMRNMIMNEELKEMNEKRTIVAYNRKLITIKNILFDMVMFAMNTINRIKTKYILWE